MELWKDIEGLEGIYAISSEGRVWSYPRIVPTGRGGRFVKGALKKSDVCRGYSFAHIGWRGCRKRVPVHRLVAQHFIKNPQGKPEVNHIDGNPGNNNVTNLEWVTRLENAQHAAKTGLYKCGEAVRHSKLKESDVRTIKRLLTERSLTITEIAKATGVSRYNVFDIRRGKTWKHVNEV